MSGPDDNIYADSPITHNHNYPAPQENWLVKAAAGAVLLATGVGAGYGVSLLASGTKDVVKDVVVPAETPKPAERPAVTIGGYELRLGK